MPYSLTRKILLFLGLLIYSLSQVFLFAQKNPQQGFIANPVTVVAVSVDPQLKTDLENNDLAIISAFFSLTVVIATLSVLYQPASAFYRHYFTHHIRAPPYSLLCHKKHNNNE